MSDIVQQLRSYAQCADAFGFPDDAHISVRAAAEIERLRGAVVRIERLAANNETGCGTCVSVIYECQAALSTPEATP